MIIGTSHFVSMEHAVTYYRPYGFDRAAVFAKRDAGEINVGKPVLKSNERIVMLDGGSQAAAGSVPGGHTMTQREAYAMLPAGTVWSCSFGYPREGGFKEYHRLPDGELWIISNGPHDAFQSFVWTCERGAK